MRICRRLYSGVGLSPTPPAHPNRMALHDWHLSQGARMMQYHDWEIPVGYNDKTVQETYRHAKEHTVLIDLSYRPQIEIHGSDSVLFLESLVVGDIKILTKKDAMYTLLTNDSGGIITDTIVTTVKDRYYMIMNTVNDVDYISRVAKEWTIFCKNVSVRVCNNSLLALHGPMADHILRILCIKDKIDFDKLCVMRSVDTYISNVPIKLIKYDENMYYISVDNQDAYIVVKELTSFIECKLGGWDVNEILRIEAGVCMQGVDVDESTTPLEADLAWTIPEYRRIKSVNRFPGYHIIMSQIQNVEGWERKRVGVMTTENRALSRHTKIMNTFGESVGLITSGCLSPMLSRGIGMAYVYNDKSKKGLYVNSYGSKLPIQICEKPFKIK